MPIKSFKTRPARIEASLPELGRIYKGMARESAAQKNVPPDLDHFRFEPASLPTATAEDIRAAFVALYGDTPKIIRNVQFISDSQPHAFDAWFESWGRSRSGAALLNRRCDGETVVFERDGDTIVRDPRPCDAFGAHSDRKCDCKASGRLRLFLPDLCAELGVLGTVTLVTHASTDIDNINGTLAFALNNAGRLRGLAFVLYREPMQLMTPAGMPITKSIVRLELDTRSAQALALEAGDAFGEHSYPLALPNGAKALPAGMPPHDADGVIYDEPADEVDPPHDAAARTYIGRAISAETRKTSKGAGRVIVLTLDNGGVIETYTREHLRSLSPLWAQTVAKWDRIGTHPFYDEAGALDVYGDGKEYTFAIPAEYAQIHAEPEGGAA